jgi:hypothetical protein
LRFTNHWIGVYAKGATLRLRHALNLGAQDVGCLVRKVAILGLRG